MQNVLFPDFTPKPKITIDQARTYCQETSALGVTPSIQTFINLIERGDLKAVRAGGRWLIFKDSFRAYLERIEQSDYELAA